jgi:hypothetical protein
VFCCDLDFLTCCSPRTEGVDSIEDGRCTIRCVLFVMDKSAGSTPGRLCNFRFFDVDLGLVDAQEPREVSWMADSLPEGSRMVACGWRELKRSGRLAGFQYTVWNVTVLSASMLEGGEWGALRSIVGEKLKMDQSWSGPDLLDNAYVVAPEEREREYLSVWHTRLLEEAGREDSDAVWTGSWSDVAVCLEKREAE